MNRIYLDHAANTPAREEVLLEFLRAEQNYIGNTNSLHGEGRLAKAAFDEYNRRLLTLLGLDDAAYEIVYTSSATEANNLAIKGLAKAYSGFGNKILVSEFEHSSVNACLSVLKSEGWEVEFIKTTSGGKVDLDDLKRKLSPSVLLVCVTLAEGETGAIQPYREIASLLKDYPDCRFFCDSTQAVGKIPIEFSALDLFSFAPHKFGGITGTGVLVKRRDIVLTPLLHGGNSVSVYRSGSAALGLIASTVKATELALSEREEGYRRAKALSDFLKEEAGGIDGVVVNSFENPYIVNLSVLGRRASETTKFFDERGICISQKSACAITNTPSKTILCMYRDKVRAVSSFRVSLGRDTKKAEIEVFLQTLKEYANARM